MDKEYFLWLMYNLVSLRNEAENYTQIFDFVDENENIVTGEIQKSTIIVTTYETVIIYDIIYNNKTYQIDGNMRRIYEPD